MGGWTTKQFAPSIIAGLVGAAIVAASLTLTGNLSVGGTISQTAGNNVLNSSSGNTGIGDATPSNKLTVQGVASATSGFYTNEASTIGINESGGSLRFRTNSLDGQMDISSVADLTLQGVVNEDGWTTLTQPSPQIVTNAADQDSNTFTFSATLNTLYAIECNLFVAGEATANDFEFRLAVSAGTMTGRGMVTHPNAADAATVTVINAAAAANTAQIPVGTFSGTSNPVHLHMTYSWVQNTSTGTFKIQFGNLVTAAGIDSLIDTNSRCRWRVIR